MSKVPATTPPLSSQCLPRPGQIISGQIQESPSTNNKEEKIQGVKKEYLEVERKFRNFGLGVGGISVLGLVAGFFKYGSTFPAKALEVVGDFFGSISAVLAPFSIIGNEIKNFYLLKEGKKENGNNGKKEEKGIFDDWREGFYRASSIGFFPFIFEPFINPVKFGQSIFHKIATVANIPNLLFTGYAWGIGNCKALLAWVLRETNQYHVNHPKSDEEKTQAKKMLKVLMNYIKTLKGWLLLEALQILHCKA